MPVTGAAKINAHRSGGWWQARQPATTASTMSPQAAASPFACRRPHRNLWVLAGNHFYGAVTAYVAGPDTARLSFTSALSAQLLKVLEEPAGEKRFVVPAVFELVINFKTAKALRVRSRDRSRREPDAFSLKIRSQPATRSASSLRAYFVQADDPETAVPRIGAFGPGDALPR